MLEKISQLAEQAATKVSRRRFLGRLGKGAGITAAALGGLLVHGSQAWAGRGKGVRMCAAPSSYTPCSGLPVGSPCPFAGGGKCATSGDEVSPGVYDCDYCKVPGSGNNGGGGGPGGGRHW